MKRSKGKNSISALESSDFRTFYSNIMQNTSNDNICAKSNQSYYKENISCDQNEFVDCELIEATINKLRHNASPGIDNITAEFLHFGKCQKLFSALSSIYSIILSYSYIPSSFTHGVIVLKKTDFES